LSSIDWSVRRRKSRERELEEIDDALRLAATDPIEQFTPSTDVDENSSQGDVSQPDMSRLDAWVGLTSLGDVRSYLRLVEEQFLAGDTNSVESNGSAMTQTRIFGVTVTTRACSQSKGLKI
jgi:hypothetical protein